MDYSKLKVKRAYLNMNVGRFKLTENMSTNEKKYVYMTISKDFFELEKKPRQIEVNLSDSVSGDEIKTIKEIKDDNISKEEH